MIELKKRLASKVASALAAGFPGAALPSESEIAGMFEYPPEAEMGELSFPCFKLSRALRCAPPKIAETLSAGFEGDPEIARTQTVGGYFNLFVEPRAFALRVCSDVYSKGEKYGSPMCGVGKTVVFDYSSPNVAKPFHIGHLGTTVIGHSLKLLHQFAGYDCIGINYLGDWGTQFGKLIVAYRTWGSRESVEQGGIDELVRLYVKFHAEAENDEKLGDLARAEFAKLESGDPEDIELWKWFIDISLREYKKTYRMLDIEFDSYLGESFYTDKMPAQIEKLRESGLLTIDDGASVVDLEKYSMPPCLILKRDGSTLYPTRDIAAAVYRKNTYKFDKCVYVTSAGQSLHFAQWFKVIELMGYPWHDELVHVPYGTVSINGAKLATRTGNVILLGELFAQAIDKIRGIMAEKNPALAGRDDIAEAVGVGAIVFYYLSNNRMRDISFVLEDALSFEGNTGPYAQYTYARTCSIIERAGEDASAPEIAEGVELGADESAVALALSKFPERVLSALEDYEPSVITRYILDLCAAFNRFYHNCQIVNCEDAALRAARLSLTRATNRVLDTALSLICMRRPNKI